MVRCSTSAGSSPLRIHPRSGSTGPPVWSRRSLPFSTGGSRRTIPVAGSSVGRFSTRPNAPSGTKSHSSTTVLAKFGSCNCGIESRSVGSNRSVMILFSRDLTRFSAFAPAKLARQFLRELFQVSHKPIHLVPARLIVGRPQNRRRMHRGHHQRCERRRHELAALFRHLEALSKQRLGGGRAKADERARTDQRDLRFQPGTARADLAGVRLGVDAPLAARLPFE